MATMLKKLGDKASNYWGQIKSLPPDEGEAQAIKEKQANVDAVTAKPTPEPERNGSEPDPQGTYGSRQGEKRLDWAMKPGAPVYDTGGDVAMEGFRKMAPSLDEADPVLKEEEVTPYTGKGARAKPPITPEPKEKEFNGGSVGGVQDTALATPMYAPGQAPAMDAPIMDNGGDVKAQPEYKSRYSEADAVAKRPVVQKPELPTMHKYVFGLENDLNDNKENTGNPSGSAAAAGAMHPILFDNGGDVKNINDGQHQVAILQTGERVLDRNEAARYRQMHGSKMPTMHESMDVDTGKPSSSLPELTPETKPTPKAPLYDQGGIVGGSNLRSMRAPLYDEGGDVEPNDDKKRLEEQGAPLDFGGRVIPNTKGVKSELDSEHVPTPMTYPGGAKMNIDNAPLNDEEHDKTFPTVMPTEASAQTKLKPYSQVLEDKAKENAAAKVNGDRGAQVSGDQRAAQPQAPPEKPEQLPTATHEEPVAIKHDEQDAMGKGIQGLTQLGMAKIHAKQLGINEEPSTEGITAPKEFAQPEQGGFPKMGEA